MTWFTKCCLKFFDTSGRGGVWWALSFTSHFSCGLSIDITGEYHTPNWVYCFFRGIVCYALFLWSSRRGNLKALPHCEAGSSYIHNKCGHHRVLNLPWDTKSFPAVSERVRHPVKHRWLFWLLLLKVFILRVVKKRSLRLEEIKSGIPNLMNCFHSSSAVKHL